MDQHQEIFLRSKLDKLIRGNDWCKWVENIFGEQYAKLISKSYFVLCPEGVGSETFRFWEVLYSGSYPIITKTAYSDLYRDLPVLVLDNFSQLNYTFLKRKKLEFSRREFNWNRLIFPIGETSLRIANWQFKMRVIV